MNMVGIFSRSKTLPVFDQDMSLHQMHRALEYVSRQLRRQGLHIVLIVSGEVLPSLLLGSRTNCKSIKITPAMPLSTKHHTALARAVKKTTQKYNLGANWLTTSSQVHSLDPSTKDAVIHASLLQDELVFSSEGLTLVAIDFCFELKTRLSSLSKGMFSNLALDEAIILLRRFVSHSKGRPLSARYLRRCYVEVATGVSDQMLLRLNAEYEAVFGERGVVGVNDEYMQWRREGNTWSPEMEQYQHQLACARRRTVVSSCFSDDSELSVGLSESDVSECNADLAAIWGKGLYN